GRSRTTAAPAPPRSGAVVAPRSALFVPPLSLGGDRRRCRGRRLARRDELLGLLEDREPDMRRQACAEPERPYLVTADALMAQAQLRDLREERRNRSLLDEIDLPCDERRQPFAVDPELHAFSLLLS